MLKRILVGVTGTPALEAKVTYTVDLAWRHGAAVELVDIVDVDRLSEVGSVPIGAGHFYDRMVKRRVQESHEASDKSVALFRQRCEGAKVDVTVIRSWLGHVSLDTTNHYAQANLETKRKALEQVGVPTAENRPARWKRDADLLAWLDTL